MKLAFILFALLFTVVQETPWTPFNDPDNRRHPERVSAIDVAHYKITVRLDDRIPPPVVEGKVEIDFSLTASTSTVELDADEMTITEILAPDETKFPFSHEGRKLSINLGRKGAPGDKFHILIKYTARPTVGLFFISPDPDRPKRPWQVWTQGETEYNHHWFPCYDYPNDRATTEVIASVREKYSTVSNGTLLKTEVNHGWRTDHWKMDIPHVVYLTSLVAGEFNVVEEPSREPLIRYFVPKGWHSDEEIRHTFGRTPEMMKFFAERTGVPYPYTKYDQVVVEDFTWGGMENVTATTLHPGTVVAKRSWADRDSDGLIAHELAHQWFGDLVTCRTWAHAWLNEGFATYMETQWQEKAAGREAMIADLEGGRDGYLGECRDQYVRPTVCEHYSTPDDVFDDHIYPKGAWILHMLNHKLGSEAFWKGVNGYLTKHRAGVVTTDDFRVAMEAASGQDLKPFFDQWTFKAGHPVFKVAAAWDQGSKKLTLTVEQVQNARKLAWQDLATEWPIFQVPVQVEFETKAGRSTHKFEIKGKSETFTVDLDSEPTIIDFDRDSAILKDLDFARTPAQLALMLAQDDQPWQRAWAAGKLGSTPEGVAALKAALHGDASTYVRTAAARALGAAKSADARAALIEKAQPDARVRRVVLEALAEYAKDSVKELEKAFQEDASPACRAAAAESLGRSGVPSAAFKDAAKFKDDEVIMLGVLSGMRGTGDPEFLKTCLASLDRTSHARIRARAAECLGDYLKDKKDAAALRRFMQLFDDSNMRVRRAAIGKAGDVKEQVVADALEKRLAREGESRLVKLIRDMIRKHREGK